MIPLSAGQALIKGGRLRALGMTGLKRSRFGPGRADHRGAGLPRFRFEQLAAVRAATQRDVVPAISGIA